MPVISAGAAVLGAAVSPVAAAYQNVWQARRDRAQQHETAIREACVRLLRAAHDVRAQVASNHGYHGEEMGARLERVRLLAADVGVYAVSVAMLVPHDPGLGNSAAEIATAVGQLIAATEAKTSRDMQVSLEAPDFTEVDASIEDFSKRGVDYFRH